ncbi:O-antigen ligase family protein [Psychroflexus planctonicus]|uniref:Ligase n=1 Tax=Psychroflexus planctonicus TaxID=1526575 RepID=A0ABQ1SG77_9FLAO|nr:O-antigen ligase family protein [Psychroflexus planctonicus]GGE32511.1 ligase [Psychroflexus planctonicus]
MLTSRINNKTKEDLKPILLHVLLGLLLYLLEPLGILYFFGFLIYFELKIIYSTNKVLWTLVAAGYVSTSEVFLRMTGSVPFWESGKYLVTFFMLQGLYFKDLKLKAFPILILALLYFPGIYVTYLNYIDIEQSFRKMILFNLSGPLSLVATALFCYKRQIKVNDILRVTDYMILPIISMAIYVTFKSPSFENVTFTTESNQQLSGGYSGNQVSTIFGMGVFLTYIRFLIPPKQIILKVLNNFFLAFFAYRALLTFSRGGLLTGLIMCGILTLLFLNWANIIAKTKVILKLGLLSLAGFVVWGYTIAVTGGLIFNRYAGINAKGVKKEDISTGRFDIFTEEIELFMQDPIFGIGVGMGNIHRIETLGHTMASHNEIGRMISEHGSFGIAALIMLILIPLFTFLFKPKNLFIIPFILFWFLTVNHSAMRVALPGFFYGYALLDITYGKKRKKKKHPLSGQQTRSEKPQLNPS